ncbi:ubiquinol--cytochrome-c reductase subunit 8 [Pseudocyphellaria aurata]|nr:ubiquinol--cytochrome-c reductase subunit 8 [Pseudocyphellaria aurata]
MGGSSGPDKLHGKYLGNWGNFGSPTQKGIISYALSANRQRPLAGTAHAAIFNTWRRFKAQALYFIPPFAIAYLAVDWAIKKNEYLNSKAGRLAEGEAAKEATDGGSVRG